MVTNWLRGGTNGTGAAATRIKGMADNTAERITRMRNLAVLLRAQAADTSIGLYRRKFENLASEMEEAATDAESLARFLARPLAS